MAAFQIALAGQFDASPILREDGTIDLRRIRAELVCRACRVPALRRRVLRADRASYRQPLGLGGWTGRRTCARRRLPSTRVPLVAPPLTENPSRRCPSRRAAGPPGTAAKRRHAVTAVAEMLRTYPTDLGGVDREKLRDCIEACLDCAQTCTACADACLSEDRSPS